MLTVRLIPCLDTHEGRVVKGVRFQNLRDAGNPEELAAAYEAQGADEIVLLDVSATPEGRSNAHETVRRVRHALSIPLTVGGGVRTVDDAAALLDAGADKVGLNTAAFRTPELITELAGRFGAQCIVVAVDAAVTPDGNYELVVASGRERTGKDIVEWCRHVTALGAGELLLTSWDRDGTREGYDLELLEQVATSVTVPVIASGGAASADHFQEAIAAGADAVLAASIFHDGEATVQEIKRHLAALGMEVRL